MARETEFFMANKPDDTSQTEFVAAIDFGSRSAGLTLYVHQNGRRLTQKPSIKIKCSLAEGMDDKHHSIKEKNKKKALLAAEIFQTLLAGKQVPEETLAKLGLSAADLAELKKDVDALAFSISGRKVEKVYALATAALRDAQAAGKESDFIKELPKTLGHPLHIVSGEAEAEFQAHGIYSKIPNAKGVVGDLGGGSLELAELDGKGLAPGKTMSLKRGFLRLQSLTDGMASWQDQAQTIRAVLKNDLNAGEADGIKYENVENFFMAGSSWRIVSTILTQRTGRKGATEIEWKAAQDELAKMTAQGADYFKAADIKNIVRGRETELAFAAVALETVLQRINPEKLVAPQTNIRDGIIHALMTGAAIFKQTFG